MKINLKKEASAGIIVYCYEQGEIYYLLLLYTAGHWDFAKGHKEAGESKKEAALRELKEETGLSVSLDPGFEESITYNFVDYNGIYTHKTVYFFVGIAKTTAVTLSDEHVDYAWLPYKDAVKKLTYTNAQVVLQKAHNFIIAK